MPVVGRKCYICPWGDFGGPSYVVKSVKLHVYPSNKYTNNQKSNWFMAFPIIETKAYLICPIGELEDLHGRSTDINTKCTDVATQQGMHGRQQNLALCSNYLFKYSIQFYHSWCALLGNWRTFTEGQYTLLRNVFAMTHSPINGKKM